MGIPGFLKGSTFALGLLIAVLTAGGIYAAIKVLRLAPPKSMVLAAGPENGAYYSIAERYRDILARDGIEVDIRVTAGSAENAKLIADPGSDVDVAILQGGISPEGDEVEALASVFPEPLLIFAQQSLSADEGLIRPDTWTAYRVAGGAEGSGTRALLDELQTVTAAPALGLEANPQVGALGGMSAAEALISGDADIAMFVAPLNAPYVRRLVESSNLLLIELAHMKTLANSLAGARLVYLSSGALSYQRPYPRKTMALLAMIAKVVAREDLHPSLVNRMVHAMVEVHEQKSPLALSGEFPNTEEMAMRADTYAGKLLKDGFSPLEAVLPYWIVAQVNRFILLLLPAFFLLFPLFKILPGFYAWRMSARVYKHYERIHEIDRAAPAERISEIDDDTLTELAARLDTVEAELRDETLPLKYRENAYFAIEHINYVRKRILRALSDRAD